MSESSSEIPGTSFTEEENEELIRLLQKVQHGNYRWPTEECMRVAHQTFSVWATELIIARRGHHGQNEILLTPYEGSIEEFKGMWHIPGGYDRWPRYSIGDTCKSVAERELGITIVPGRVIDAFKWPTRREDPLLGHPYGRPLSLYVECTAPTEMAEDDTRRFFAADRLPDAIVGPHRRFILEHLPNLQPKI